LPDESKILWENSNKYPSDNNKIYYVNVEAAEKYFNDVARNLKWSIVDRIEVIVQLVKHNALNISVPEACSKILSHILQPEHWIVSNNIAYNKFEDLIKVVSELRRSQKNIFELQTVQANYDSEKTIDKLYKIICNSNNISKILLFKNVALKINGLTISGKLSSITHSVIPNEPTLYTIGTSKCIYILYEYNLIYIHVHVYNVYILDFPNGTTEDFMIYDTITFIKLYQNLSNDKLINGFTKNYINEDIKFEKYNHDLNNFNPICISDYIEDKIVGKEQNYILNDLVDSDDDSSYENEYVDCDDEEDENDDEDEDDDDDDDDVNVNDDDNEDDFVVDNSNQI
jgi:hypothetical protein